MSDFAARNKVAIAGYAQSPILRRSPMALGAIALQTAEAAIADAGLKIADIDGFVSTPLFPTLGSHAAQDGVSFVSAHWLAQHLGIVPPYACSLQGQVPGALATAVNAVASGAAKYVLVHRALHNPPGSYHRNERREVGGLDQWGAPQGHFGPIAAIAMAYNEYVQRYGVGDDALAPVVMEARKNGARIPWSYWANKPLSAEDYRKSPFINDPIRMYDCDIPVDGVTAFILCSAARARDLPHRPAYVTAYAESLPSRQRIPSLWPLDDIMAGGETLLSQLWDRAGVAPRSVDYPQLYDGFSPLVLFWMELLGLCPRGEAWRMAAEGGIDSDRPDAVPVLASGGALGNGRMHGTPQVLECYLQLAGRAGERQREGLSLALACQGIPNIGGVTLFSSEPF
jgi:acetyl-CoA acetyltransferase